MIILKGFYFDFYKDVSWQGVVVQAYNLSTQETEIGRS
jgi:hypothetical protein